MIFANRVKAKLQEFFKQPVALLAKIGVNMGHIIAFKFLISILVGVCIFFISQIQPFILLLLPLSLIAIMELNIIIEMFECEYNQKSKLNTILNEFFDIFSEVVIYAPFMWVIGVDILLITIIITLIIISEIIGIRPQRDTPRCHNGLMGRGRRAFCFSLMAIAILIYPSFLHFTNIIIGTIGLLILCTAINKFKNA